LCAVDHQNKVLQWNIYHVVGVKMGKCGKTWRTSSNNETHNLLRWKVLGSDWLGAWQRWILGANCV